MAKYGEKKFTVILRADQRYIFATSVALLSYISNDLCSIFREYIAVDVESLIKSAPDDDIQELHITLSPRGDEIHNFTDFMPLHQDIEEEVFNHAVKSRHKAPLELDVLLDLHVQAACNIAFRVIASVFDKDPSMTALLEIQPITINNDGKYELPYRVSIYQYKERKNGKRKGN